MLTEQTKACACPAANDARALHQLGARWQVAAARCKRSEGMLLLMTKDIKGAEEALNAAIDLCRKAGDGKEELETVCAREQRGGLDILSRRGCACIAEEEVWGSGGDNAVLLGCMRVVCAGEVDCTTARRAGELV